MTAPNAATLKGDAVGLFLDVDGTILDLAPTPDAVEVPLGLLDELSSLERRLGGALALVSGRPIDELDKLFAPLRLRASGVHGGEIRYAPEERSLPLATRRLPDEAFTRLSRLIDEFPGTFVENKGVSFAVHYRFDGARARELCQALRELAEECKEPPLEVIGGRKVYEIKLAGFDKGTAVESFMARAPFAGRRPIFVADDRVDRPGFDKAIALGGLALSVGAELPGVSGWFATPAELRGWLAGLGQ